MAFSRELGLACFTAFTTLILIIATGSNNWAGYTLNAGTYTADFHFGLFVACSTYGAISGCVSMSGSGATGGESGWLGACQFFAIIAILMAIFVTLVMFLQVGKVKIPIPIHEARMVNILTGIMIAIVLCILLAFAIFAGKVSDASGGLYDFNWGFALMIISCLFFIGITLGYFVTKKGAPASSGSTASPATPAPASADTAA